MLRKIGRGQGGEAAAEGAPQAAPQNPVAGEAAAGDALQVYDPAVGEAMERQIALQRRLLSRRHSDGDDDGKDDRRATALAAATQVEKPTSGSTAAKTYNEIHEAMDKVPEIIKLLDVERSRQVLREGDTLQELEKLLVVKGKAARSSEVNLEDLGKLCDEGVGVLK